jgi:hypothetical protein
MTEVFVLLLVTITTAIAYWATRRTHSARIPSVRAAIRALVDFVGASAIFFIFNVAVGVTVILLIRTFTQLFIPLYGLASLVLAVLSAAQGFVFHQWWRHD